MSDVDSHDPEQPRALDSGDAASKLNRSVRRTRERRERAVREGPPTVAQSLAWIGTLGWLIVAPMIGAMFIGRWLDRQLGTGVALAGALCIVGLVTGCALAWRKVQQR